MITTTTWTPSIQRTKCEIYTRVMGYFRPVSHFNIGKKAEHYGRKHFSESVSINSRFIAKYSQQQKKCNNIMI